MASSKTSSLLDRELEYKKLNAELESKTANLVREAESILKQNEHILSSSYNKKTSLLDNVTAEDILNDYEAELSEPQFTNERSDLFRTTHHKQKSQSNSSKVNNINSGNASNNQSMAMAQSQAFMTDIGRELSNKVAEIEADPTVGETEIPDVLPMAAQEMSAEAQLRFLKAKIRVSEEEIERLTIEIHKLQEENKKLSSKTKEAEEEKTKALRGTNTLQSQLEKYRKLSEDNAGRADTLEKQLTALKRDHDQLKRSEKQKTAGLQAAEVRLNRALEEAEKARSDVSKARNARKDADDSERKRADGLAAENRRLERQKSDLITAFRKQLKLIDVLKRQRMHLEAAKMLDFTEEEFVKALDWDK